MCQSDPIPCLEAEGLMRTRIFFISYHMDGEELENEINELIETVEKAGEEVVDLDLQVVPVRVADSKNTYFGNRYLVLLKCKDRATGQEEP
jgi:hypothetical protein